ncbi:hypothetical protein DS65_03895 [Mesotoga sp. SC_4PWL113PWK15]|nr:hypothetical protein DS65_03895 [Mesotoga sp. SC_4PWL113PWK15]
MQFFCRGERLFARKGNPPPRPDWLPYFSPYRERSERLDSALSLRKRFSGLLSKSALNSVQRGLDLKRIAALHSVQRGLDLKRIAALHSVQRSRSSRRTALKSEKRFFQLISFFGERSYTEGLGIG